MAEAEVNKKMADCRLTKAAACANIQLNYLLFKLGFIMKTATKTNNIFFFSFIFNFTFSMSKAYSRLERRDMLAVS